MYSFARVCVCVHACMKSHANNCVIICRVFGSRVPALCVCVIKLHGSAAQQLLCNGVHWESVLERDYLVLHVYMRDLADTHVPASFSRLAHFTHAPTIMSISEVTTKSTELPVPRRRGKLKLSTTRE